MSKIGRDRVLYLSRGWKKGSNFHTLHLKKDSSFFGHKKKAHNYKSYLILFNCFSTDDKITTTSTAITTTIFFPVNVKVKNAGKKQLTEKEIMKNRKEGKNKNKGEGKKKKEIKERKRKWEKIMENWKKIWKERKNEK